jgi:glycosyltransferase involved in cell wall biosynthesis
MRIAVDGRYIQDHFPGIGRYTFNLIRHLAAQSDDHFVVFYNPALRNTRYDISELGRPRNVTLVPLGVATFSLGEQWRLPLAALRQKADLLHSPYYIKPYLPPLPSVSTVYDAISAHYPEYLPSRRARLLFDVTMRLAQATSRRVLTLSHSSRADLERFYGTAPDKVIVTYLAAEARYRPLERAQCIGLSSRHALPRRFALYVGINKPHKNLATLLEALALARRQCDARLVIAGAYDPRWPQAREAVKHLGLADAVTFLPDVPEQDLPALYNLADFFVFPSLCEGFGLPPLEAMACGVPVLCANSSSLPEVVGEAAIMVAARDVPAWAAAICELWDSPERRVELAERGLRQAAAFSWEKTAVRTIDAYREALRS